MKKIISTVLIISNFVALADSQGVTSTTVGSDGCDFTSIQAAIDSNAAQIRVTQGTFNETLSISNSSVEIIGGYANCSSAANNINITGNSTINAGDNAVGLYVSHNTNDDVDIELSNLVFERGKAGDSDLAGGILVNGNVNAQTSIKMTNVAIYFSTGSGLGLINVNSAILKDINIVDNIGFNGGGIYSFASEIILYGNTNIDNNTANNFGGGIYLTNGSNFNMFSTSAADSLRGLSENVAKHKGGGIYAQSGSKAFLISERVQLPLGSVGNNSSSIALFNNLAGDATTSGDGGGIYLTDTDTILVINDATLDYNRATGNGGAIAVTNNAGLIITHPPAYQCKLGSQCNIIKNNSAGINNSVGGAIFIDSGAEAFIANTYFAENKADFGSAIYISGNNTKLTVEGSTFYRHLPDNDRDGKYVIRAFTGSEAIVGFSSFKNNNALEATFGIFQADFTLAASIVHDSEGTTVLSSSDSNITNYCILSHDITSLSGTNLIQSTDSPFVNTFGNDVHLNSDTLAIDACDTSVYSPIFADIDLETRGLDSATPNLDGVYDMGADEFWTDEIIFKDGF